MTTHQEPRLGPLGPRAAETADEAGAARTGLRGPLRAEATTRPSEGAEKTAESGIEDGFESALQLERVIHGTLSEDRWGWLRRGLASLTAILFHLAILFFLLVPTVEEAPLEPPTIPVEIVNLPPPKPKEAPKPKPDVKKPEPKKPVEQPPPPKLEQLESGGSPELKAGRPQEAKPPEPTQQAAAPQEEPTPQPPPPAPAPPAPRSAPKSEQQAPLKPVPRPRETARTKQPASPLKLPTTPDQAAPPQVAALPPPSRSVPRAAPSGAPPTKAAPAQIESDLVGQGGGDRYLNAMRDLIVSNLLYPSAGRGQRGVAQYEMLVDRRGYIQALQLTRSSGSTALDRAGADAIQNSAPFQPLPNNVPGPYVGIIVRLYIGPS